MHRDKLEWTVFNIPSDHKYKKENSGDVFDLYYRPYALVIQ